MPTLVKINLHNGYAELASPSLELEELIRDVVSYDEREYVPYRNTYVVTRKSLVDREGRFPPGCVELLPAVLGSEYDVQVNDYRARPTPKIYEPAWDHLPADLTPFQFQRDAALTVLKKGMGIIKADVGAGKSLIVGMIVAAMPIRWVVLVHRDNLVQDLSTLFTKLGIEHVTHTSKRRRTAEVTIATYSSARDPKVAAALVGGAQGIIVDESHTVAADTHIAVVHAARNAFYRIGLSGTPLDRSDTRNIIAIGELGPIVYNIKPQALVAMGRTVAAQVKMLTYKHRISKKVEYNAIYREAIVNNRERNLLVLEAIKAARKPCMVFFTQIDQLHNVKALAQKHAPELQVGAVWGESTQEERDLMQSLARQESGLDVILTNVVFQEGVNIPNLGSVVIAGAGKAMIQIVQRLGRGVRSSSGKGDFELWDIHDQELEMFHKQAMAHIRIYRKRGYEPQYVELKV